MSASTSAEVSASPSPAPSSVSNNAPKYGTLVPNRVFVGGISASTTEQDLLELFSRYGSVKATKIISDRAGVSKGYGFVTFETEEEATRLTEEEDNIVLKDRKLNIAPAIKKQVSDLSAFHQPSYSPRLLEASPAALAAAGGATVFFGNGATYAAFANSGVPMVAHQEYQAAYPPTGTATHTVAAPAAQPQNPYSTVMYPQPVFYPQQYHQYQPPPQQTYQPQWNPATAATQQWRWITPGSYAQPAGGVYPSDGLYTQISPAYITPDRSY